MQQRANVELLDGYEVRELRGAGALESLVVDGDRRRARAAGRSGVCCPRRRSQQPRWSRNLVETDADGFIVVNPFHETSTPGVYAAGDVSTIYSEQVLTAIGDGARAAMSAYDYVLSERLWPRQRCVSIERWSG